MGEGLGVAVGPAALSSGAQLALLDLVGCGIWFYDGESILYVNHALERLTGFSREQLLSPNFFETLIHPEDREFIVARGRARVRGESVPEQYDVRIVAADGTVRNLSIHARRVLLENSPVSVVSATDTTRLRDAERLIQDGRDRVVALLNAIPAHIIATDLGGKPTFINRHWLEFTGQRQDEALAHGTAPLIHPDDLAAATEAWAIALRTRRPYEIEYRVRDRQGEFRWQTFRIEPVLTDADGVIGWIGVSIDVHETRQLRATLEETVAQLADAMESKDEVLGLISHELRTPLTTLLGNAGYLLRHGEEIEPEGRRAIVADVAADTRRLYAVIENMLVLSRMESGTPVEMEPARLHHLIEATIEDFRQRSPLREVRVEAPAATPLVSVNPTYYKQILGNLLSNANKYSPPEEPILVALREADGFIESSVVDAGHGIPEHELENVFSPFFRLKGHSDLTGTGLGLTVCRRLVELHGGAIEVRNLEGGGCRFSFTVPVADFEGIEAT